MPTFRPIKTLHIGGEIAETFIDLDQVVAVGHIEMKGLPIEYRRVFAGSAEFSVLNSYDNMHTIFKGMIPPELKLRFPDPYP